MTHLDRRAGAFQLNGQGPRGALAGVFGRVRLGGLAVGCLKLQVGAHLHVACTTELRQSYCGTET